MKTIELPQETHCSRFLAITAMSITAVEISMIGSADAQPDKKFAETFA